MDDDLEKCDGEYFPCEFCGDPYPVEYLMRHQVGKNRNHERDLTITTPIPK